MIIAASVAMIIVGGLSILTGITAGALPSTWTMQPLGGYGASSFEAIACVSTQLCWAVGSDPSGTVGVVLATSNGGTTWSPQILPSGTGPLTGISCASTSQCGAVGSNPAGTTGSVVATTNAGTTWSDEVLPNSTDPLSEVT